MSEIIEFGSINSVSATIVFTSFDSNGNQNTISEDVGNLTPDFEITNNMSIRILPKSNVVRVIGNVYNPGLVAVNNSVSFKKVVELSGGF